MIVYVPAKNKLLFPFMYSPTKLNYCISTFTIYSSSGLLIAWWGITIRMGTYNLKNRAMYWHSAWGGVDFGFANLMSLRVWEMIWRHLVCPDPPTSYSEATNAPIPQEPFVMS
jgi:hypothetical protein